MTIRRISLPLLIVLALAGCANGGTDGPVVPPAGTPSSAPPATSAAPDVEESGSTKPSGGSTQTLTGTIAAGVEANCLLLDDHLLIINDPALRSAAKVGATVTVTGRVEQGMMTTCQQGTPFLVVALRAN